jgi:hypothetical protein
MFPNSIVSMGDPAFCILVKMKSRAKHIPAATPKILPINPPGDRLSKKNKTIPVKMNSMAITSRNVVLSLSSHIPSKVTINSWATYWSKIALAAVVSLVARTNVITVPENDIAPAICGKDQVKCGLRTRSRIKMDAMALLSPDIASGWQSTILISNPPRLHSSAVITIKTVADLWLISLLPDSILIM